MTTPNQHQLNQSELISSDPMVDWANIVKQWKASRLSQTAYCEANKMNYNQFVYQKAKRSIHTQVSSTLLPVRITQHEPAVAVQNHFVLHYPSGLKLQIPINAHPEAIKALIHCLEKHSC